jgi:hypothetical protein
MERSNVNLFSESTNYTNVFINYAAQVKFMTHPGRYDLMTY